MGERIIKNVIRGERASRTQVNIKKRTASQ